MPIRKGGTPGHAGAKKTRTPEKLVGGTQGSLREQKTSKELEGTEFEGRREEGYRKH